MTAPKISVVVPTYNRVGHVEGAIQSVLDQDYENFELLVIDDGSEDETPKLLERIEARDTSGRFKWLRQENAGQAAAVNRGFAMVDGDLLGYLSSDDLLLPGAFEKLARAAQADPEAEVFYPWYRMADLDGASRDEVRPPTHDFVTALRHGTCCPGVGTLVRRSFYERVGDWNTSFRYVPDLEWWLRAADTKFHCVQEVLAVFTAHSGSLTFDSEKRRRWEERVRLLDELFARDDLPEEAYAARDEAYASVFIMAALELLVRDGQYLGSSRWTVEDHIGPLFSEKERHRREESLVALNWHNHSLVARAEAAESMVEQLQASLDLLEDARLHREARIAELEAALTRPVWRRAARRLVPPRLRPYAAAVWRRLRSVDA